MLTHLVVSLIYTILGGSGVDILGKTNRSHITSFCNGRMVLCLRSNVVNLSENAMCMTVWLYQRDYTANFYRDLHGVYKEIRVRGFQIYGDCLLQEIPEILKSPHSHFHFNICGEFDVQDAYYGDTPHYSEVSIIRPGCSRLLGF